MRVDLKKILIYGIEDQLNTFLNTSQEKGFIEFIGLSKVQKISPIINDFINAIKILKKQPIQHEQKEAIDAKVLVKKILHLTHGIEKLLEEKRIIKAEIMRIGPFGDFSIENIKDLEQKIHKSFQFLTIKKSKKEKIKLPEELIYISTAYDLDYYLAINKEKKFYPKMIEIFIDKSLKQLKQKEDLIIKQIEKMQKEIKEFSRYLNFLKTEFIKELNIFNLSSAKASVIFPINNNFFIIQAWIPKNKIEKLKLVIKDFNINFEEILIEKKDRLPTYLENKKNAKIGEDLVKIYDIPSAVDKDPSIWILIFFAIFFAIIVSDAGYGFLYFGIFLFLKWKFKKPGAILKRFIKLTCILSISCIVWGIITGSFFGLNPTLKNPISKYNVLNVAAQRKAKYHLEKKDDIYKYWQKKYSKIVTSKDGKEFLEQIVQIKDGKKSFVALDEFKNNILMEFTLFLGVLHIMLSFIRYMKKHWAGIGWIFFMIGGYLFFPSILRATSIIHFYNILDKENCFFIGKILVFSGIILAVGLAFIQKRLKGLVEITVMVNVFADILSYLRLYALALAGMIMATTFNDLGLKVGLSFGFLIIIVGHLINLLLAVMGGVIHGLRLNFIEWYHYSFEGDGKLFNPLKLIK